MKNIDEHILEFVNFCRDIVKEVRMLREDYLLEEMPTIELFNKIKELKANLSNVSARQHEAFLKIKKFEAISIEKIKNSPNVYRGDQEAKALKIKKVQELAAKRMAAVDKAAEATKAQLRNQIASTQTTLKAAIKARKGELHGNRLKRGAAKLEKARKVANAEKLRNVGAERLEKIRKAVSAEKVKAATEKEKAAAEKIEKLRKVGAETRAAKKAAAEKIEKLQKAGAERLGNIKKAVSAEKVKAATEKEKAAAEKIEKLKKAGAEKLKNIGSTKNQYYANIKKDLDIAVKKATDPKELAKSIKGKIQQTSEPVSKTLAQGEKVASKFGTKGKIAAGLLAGTAAAGGAYAYYKKKHKKVKEGFDYSTLLPYDK